MTWSLSNTVTYSSGADSHTALEYLFDTALSGLSNWTVSAHPSASSTKRVAKRTTTTLYGGGAYSEHFWVDWASSSNPTSLTVYEDATYTTSPGDLATDTTNQKASSLTLGGVDSLAWKFWTSDQNANALLVTRGKAIIFWEPGYSVANLMEDPSWDGSSDSRRGQIFPGLRDSLLWMTGWPDTNSPTTGSEYSWTHGAGSQVGSGFWDGERIDLNVPFIATGTSSSSPTTAGRFLFPGTGNDVGVYRPASPTSSGMFWCNPSSVGNLMLANSNYYLTSYDDTAKIQMVFLFGTSEPNFS